MKSSAMPEVAFEPRQKPTDVEIIERLHSESARQDTEIDNLREALADSQAYNAKLIGDLARLQNQTNLLAERLQESAQDYVEAAQRIAELEQCFDSERQRHHETGAKVPPLMARIAELEAQLSAVLDTVDAATQADGRTYAEGCVP